MYHFSAQRPTVITVGNPQQTNSLSAPLLNGTSRLESCKFLEDLQAYAAALQASEALSRPAAEVEEFESATESEDDSNEAEAVPAGGPAPPSRIVRSPMLQFCPDPSEVSVPPEMNSLIPVIRRFISPRLLSAIPLLCPEAEEDNEQLLAWIYSNSLIHDEALADRLLSKISMNPSIKESSMRLADYVLRFQDLKKQISHLIFKEDHFLSSFIKGITPSSVSSRVFSSFKNGLDGTTTWEGRSVENTAAYYAYRRKYIDEPPQARGPATARANSKLDAAWKAQHHKSAPVVARNQHRMKTRNRTSH
ncbi:hypothetical protein GEMRC1_009097 [Eukaryota sp. GEM-RC1]